MAPESEKPALTAEMLAAHEGQRENAPAFGNQNDDVDRTLNATRNSNSFDASAADAYPETMMDDAFARAEESKTPAAQIERTADDDLSRDELGTTDKELAPISEQETMNRSTLIVQEHEKQHQTEVKQSQILDNMKNKPLPFQQDGLANSSYQYAEEPHGAGADSSANLVLR